MKTLIIGFIAIVSIINIADAKSGKTHSHKGGHKHSHSESTPVSVPISDSIAIIVAKNCAYILADVKKITEDWKDAKHLKVEKIKSGKAFEWKVSFKTNKSKDSKEKTLYIFLTFDGKYIAGNFTGK